MAESLLYEPVFLNVYGAQGSIPRNEFHQPISLASRYDNPIPTRFLAPKDCLKIPALYCRIQGEPARDPSQNKQS